MDIASKAAEAQAELDSYHAKVAEIATLSQQLRNSAEWLAVEAKRTEIETARRQAKALAAELEEGVQSLVGDINGLVIASSDTATAPTEPADPPPDNEAG